MILPVAVIGFALFLYLVDWARDWLARDWTKLR